MILKAFCIHSTKATPGGLAEENEHKRPQKGDFPWKMSFAIGSMTLFFSFPLTGVEKASSDPLQLSARVITDGPLYPGKDAKLVYEISFQGNINLIQETLPLFDAQGFVKVGSLQVKQRGEKNYNVQEITQRVQASQPGTYHYPESILEGIYYEDLGLRGTASHHVRAVAPEITIEIHPFPNEGMPASFNGALGEEFQLSLEALSPTSVTVADTIKLKLSISGKGEFTTVDMPDIACQPGMSGFFGISDFPPLVNQKKNQKTFTFEVNPLSSVVKKFPPLEFSFFNPNTKTYTILRSKEIPVQVTPLEPDLDAIQKQWAKPEEATATIGQADIDWKKTLQEAPREVLREPYLLHLHALERPLPSLIWYLTLIPSGILFLYLQKNLKNLWAEMQKSKQPKASFQLLSNAKHCTQEPDLCFENLKTALILKLAEEGFLSQPISIPDDLPEKGISGEVKYFLETLMQSLYAPQKTFDSVHAVQEAEVLYKKIKGSIHGDV